MFKESIIVFAITALRNLVMKEIEDARIRDRFNQLLEILRKIALALTDRIRPNRPQLQAIWRIERVELIAWGLEEAMLDADLLFADADVALSYKNMTLELINELKKRHQLADGSNRV